MHAYATPIAMIMDIKGNVQINGKEAELLKELNINNQITVANQSTLTITYLSSGTEYTLNGPATAEIGKNEISSQNKVTKKNLQIASFTDISIPQFSQAAIVMRAEDKVEDSITLLSPNSSKTLSASPSFMWLSPGEGFSYRIEVFSEQEDSLYTLQTTKTSVKLPNDVTLPRDQLLSWEIEASKGQVVLYNIAEFSIANNTELAVIKKSRPTKEASFSEILLYAWKIDKMGFKHEAQKYWQTLANLRPNNPVIQKRLQ